MTRTERVTIEKAVPADMNAILALLVDSGLPNDGSAACLPAVLLARQDGQLVGCVALEPYGRAALLRSLAVRQDQRGRGIGQDLVRQILEVARQQQVEELFLLTETAAAFFADHFAFVPVDRVEIDPAVQQSFEFTTACPETAQAMFLIL